MRESVAAQEQVVNTLRTSYRAGSAASVEVLEAERDLYFVRSELALARYEYLLNTLRLKHAAGTLAVSDLEMVNAFLNAGEVDLAPYGGAGFSPRDAG